VRRPSCDCKKAGRGFLEIISIINDISESIELASYSSDPSYRGHLGEGTEGPRGEVRGGSSLEGDGKRAVVA
jgi:hypothetical protein